MPLYLLDIDFDSTIVVFIQGFEGTWIRRDIAKQSFYVSIILITLIKLLKVSQYLGCCFRLTAHGVQPHKATDVVVKVHVPAFIAVSADYHLEQLVIEREAWRRMMNSSFITIPLYTSTQRSLSMFRNIWLLLDWPTIYPGAGMMIRQFA